MEKHPNTRPLATRQTPSSMKWPRFLLAMAALVTISTTAGAQAGGSELTANQIFDRAAKAQAGDITSTPSELSLQAQMLIRTIAQNGQDVQIQVQRKFLSPAYIWTRMDDDFSGSFTYSGFDGERGWYRKEGRTIYYDGAEFDADRKRLQRDIEDTALFARVFLLHNLRAELRDLRRLEDETGHGLTAYVLEGSGNLQPAIKNAAAETVNVKLWIDQAAGNQFLGARVTFANSPRPPLQICFTRHRIQNGVTIPGHIEIYENDASKPSTIITVDSIDFRAKLSKQDFQ